MTKGGDQSECLCSLISVLFIRYQNNNKKIVKHAQFTRKTFTYHNIVTKVRDTGTSLNHMNAYYSLVMIYTFSRDLTIPHLDLSHFALCIMGKAIFG